MTALTEEGRGAIPAVAPLLQDRNEGVRWAAIRVLADIGDETVLLPLITLLEQSKNAPDVIRTLQAITGQDFGDKPLAWREWVLQQNKEGAGLPAGLLSDKALLAAAIRDLPATLSGDDRDYTVTVTLPDRRAQNIRVDFSGADADGHPVIQLTTPCGAAVPEQYEAALKLNLSIPYGAIGLALLDDVLCFALIHTHLRATAHPADIAGSLMCLARHGDALERAGSTRDTF